MRFNPPPNWPAPPPGWAPDENWSPDPSWPPPPPGWQLWVDDRPRRARWAALAVVAAVILAAGAVFAVFALEHSTSAGEKASRKPDITQLTRDLLVDKSAFPEIDGGRRTSGVGNSGNKAPGAPEVMVDPEECAAFYGFPKAATQSAYAAVSKAGRGDVRSIEVRLAITPDQPNLKDAVDNCRSFTVSLGAAGSAASVQTQLDPLEVPDLPPWAVATTMKSSSSPLPGLPIVLSMTTTTISGYYRGVLITARNNDLTRQTDEGSGPADDDTVNDLARLFNAQVAQLEAAP